MGNLRQLTGLLNAQFLLLTSTICALTLCGLYAVNLKHKDYLLQTRINTETMERLTGDERCAERMKVYASRLDDKLAILEAEVGQLNLEYNKVKRSILKLKPDLRTDLVFRYSRAITQGAMAYDVDPDLVVALAFVESSFNHRAESRAGARGLLQVMPFWAEEFDVQFDVNYLYDIEYNVDVGLSIYKHYLWQCQGEITCALFRYHGSYGTSGDYAGKVMRHYMRLKGSD